MAAPALAQTYIPEILLQQARLDNVPIGQLIEQARTAVDDLPEPAALEPSPAPEQELCTLPLLDANGLLCREISESEAWRLIHAGNAVGQMANGWDTDRRGDLPLLTVQLRVPRAVIQWSNACLDDHDSEAVAGLHGDIAERIAREKVDAWPQVK